MSFRFLPGPRDATTRARRGAFETPHGRVETPVFMPVGTRATVTGMTPEDLHSVGAEIILGNTYHLMLRPGPEAMEKFGGIHRFMGWDRPVLTDSGGFQIFSLPGHRAITEEGARFKSYVEGSYHLLSPETSIAVQTAIGSDVMMVLDVCLPSTSEPAAIREAMDRTHRWALRSLAARTNPEQALFAIVQGGLDPALRAESARFLTQHPFDGFAIGGLAVGDTRAERGEVIDLTIDRLPSDKPRYLMGVGTPPDLIEAIGHGVDMFDCVIPTALAWQGTAFTSRGRVRITRTELRLSDAPLDPACGCNACTRYSRGYLHHLMKCREPLGPRLLSLHNLQHYLDLMRAARRAIEAGRYAAFARETLEAIDRYEHDASGRPPGRRAAPGSPSQGDIPCPSPRQGDGARVTPPHPSLSPAGGEGNSEARFDFVVTRDGATAVVDRVVGEVMHPVIGPAAESERLYVAQSRLRARLAEAGGPLVLFDVGLGAGSNALAAWRASDVAPAGSRPLEIVSFERDLGALALALSPGGVTRLGISAAEAEAARALIADGQHASGRTVWRLRLGEALETLAADPALADVVFWDPFSPKANPGLWTHEAFRTLRSRCAPRATVFTYSTATATRSAMLLAGFYVGTGDASGPKEQTTAAAADPADLARPLDRRWLERLERSSAPFPPDAPADALDRIRRHPQFS
jgi:queuine tRNA-ribosyltransferase